MDIKQKLNVAIAKSEAKHTEFYQNLKDGWQKAPLKLLPIKQALWEIYDVVKNDPSAKISTPDDTQDDMLILSLNNSHHVRVDYNAEDGNFSLEFLFTDRSESNETHESTTDVNQAIDWIIEWAGSAIGIERAFKKVNPYS